MPSANFEYVRGWKKEFETKGWWHSFELPDGRRIEGVCRIEGLRERIAAHEIPEDLRGARVLDIGAWDGWYSFEMERRGADVVAVDCWDNPRFHQMRAALGSRVEYREMDVYELRPGNLGRFDIVLFMGVLYHLKHPLLGLERVCELTTDLAVVDSFILREQHLPGVGVEERAVMEFYESEEFGGQSDNWCGPSLPCLMAMCRTAGFARVIHRATLSNGACISCYRRWEPPRQAADRAPELLKAFHTTNFGINFDSTRDEYVTAVFRARAEDLSLDVVKPQVGEFGVRGIHLSRREAGTWQVNFKLPPGLESGWHPVTVRVAEGPASNAVPVAVDIKLVTPTLAVRGVADGTTWKPGELDLTQGDSLVLWVEGLPDNADRNNVRVSVGGERVPVWFVGSGQVNLRIPPEMPRGRFDVVLELGGAHSAIAEVKVIGGIGL